VKESEFKLKTFTLIHVKSPSILIKSLISYQLHQAGSSNGNIYIIVAILEHEHDAIVFINSLQVILSASSGSLRKQIVIGAYIHSSCL
jgi:hypothetical protein